MDVANIDCSASLIDECLKLPQVECPLNHHFCGGVYARQVTMPADTFVIGKKHKTSHFNIILKGKAHVLIDGVVSIIEAPCILNSAENIRKILYIVDDMTWVTIHATQETDIEKLENDLVFSIADDDNRISAEDVNLLISGVVK